MYTKLCDLQFNHKHCGSKSMTDIQSPKLHHSITLIYYQIYQAICWNNTTNIWPICLTMSRLWIHMPSLKILTYSRFFHVHIKPPLSSTQLVEAKTFFKIEDVTFALSFSINKAIQWIEYILSIMFPILNFVEVSIIISIIK